MAPQVATGFILPIKAKDIRIKVKVDPQHPITKAMLDRLPRTSDPDLQTLLKVMRDGRDDADVRSWIALVEGEIAFRKTEPAALVEMIAAAARSNHV